MRLIWVGSMLLAASVAFLEIGSRRWQHSREPGPRPDWAVCDPERYPARPDKLQALDELSAKQTRGERISGEEVIRAAVLAPQKDMPGLNGIYCNEMIYVSTRLPGSGRRYVARHELEHVFQARGAVPEPEDHELAATWRAAAHHPFGLVVTIFSSLWAAFRSSPSLSSFLYGSWEIFKAYLLP